MLFSQYRGHRSKPLFIMYHGKMYPLCQYLFHKYHNYYFKKNTGIAYVSIVQHSFRVYSNNSQDFREATVSQMPITVDLINLILQNEFCTIYRQQFTIYRESIKSTVIYRIQCKDSLRSIVQLWREQKQVNLLLPSTSIGIDKVVTNYDNGLLIKFLSVYRNNNDNYTTYNHNGQYHTQTYSDLKTYLFALPSHKHLFIFYLRHRRGNKERNE